HPPGAAGRKSRRGSRGRTSRRRGRPRHRAPRSQRAAGPLAKRPALRPPYAANSRGRAVFLAFLGLDARGAGEILVDARDALDLALGGEALVEAFLAELARHLRPGAEAPFPARHAPGLGL